MTRSFTATTREEAEQAPTRWQRARLREYLEIPGCNKASIADRRCMGGGDGRVTPEPDEAVHVMSTASIGGWARSSELRLGCEIEADILPYHAPRTVYYNKTGKRGYVGFDGRVRF